MPHLHLSAQAGDDMVLKRMKRRHLRQDILDVVKRARDVRPDIAFGADIIAGFPTETDEMFENTRALIEEADLVYAHIFPYSEREGTPAARMPQVDHALRKERAAILRETAEKQHQNYLKKYMNKSLQIVVEKENFGHTENFIPVRFNENVPVGSLVQFQAETLEDNHLFGQVSA